MGKNDQKTEIYKIDRERDMSVSALCPLGAGHRFARPLVGTSELGRCWTRLVIEKIFLDERPFHSLRHFFLVVCTCLYCNAEQCLIA